MDALKCFWSSGCGKETAPLVLFMAPNTISCPCKFKEGSESLVSATNPLLSLSKPDIFTLAHGRGSDNYPGHWSCQAPPRHTGCGYGRFSRPLPTSNSYR